MSNLLEGGIMQIMPPFSSSLCHETLLFFSPLLWYDNPLVSPKIGRDDSTQKARSITITIKIYLWMELK